MLPEVVELEEVVKEWGISHKQMVDMGILIGTDYNPEGVKGLGPKTALKLVKEHGNLENALSYLKNAEFPVDQKKIRELFLNPDSLHTPKRCLRRIRYRPAVH